VKQIGVHLTQGFLFHDGKAPAIPLVKVGA
jgi:hypothetical protein